MLVHHKFVKITNEFLAWCLAQSTPYMGFKSIFYHSSFKQHYIKLYFHLFLEYLDHSFTVVHNMLYLPLLCDALHVCFCKQTLAHFLCSGRDFGLAISMFIEFLEHGAWIESGMQRWCLLEYLSLRV